MTVKHRSIFSAFVLAIVMTMILQSLFTGSLTTVQAKTQFTPTSTTSVKPNVVVFLIDDLDKARFNRLLQLNKLPNIKQYIVDKGVTFDQAFVADSYCCASRASILTGQYPHNTHVTWANDENGYNGYNSFHKISESGINRPTLATWMKSQEYKTMYIGKYMNGYPSLVPTIGNVPAGWDIWYGKNVSSLQQNSVGPSDNYQYVTSINGGANVITETPSLYEPRYISTRFQDNINSLITKTNGSVNPFFLMVAPYTPHVNAGTIISGTTSVNEDTYYNWPITTDTFLDNGGGYPVQTYANEYNCPNGPNNCLSGEQLPHADSTASALYWDSLCTPYEFEQKMKPEEVCSSHWTPTASSGLAQLTRQYQQGMEAMMSVDIMVGKIMNSISSTAGSLDNTLIIFTSDNGVMLGEHRLAQKHMPYQEATGVPLIISKPNAVSSIPITNSALALNIDLFPTIVDYVNSSTLSSVGEQFAIDGRSVRWFADDASHTATPTNWRSWFLNSHSESASADTRHYIWPAYYALQTAKYPANNQIAFSITITGTNNLPRTLVYNKDFWYNQLYVEYTSTLELNNTNVHDYYQYLNYTYTDTQHEHYDMRVDADQSHNTYADYIPDGSYTHYVDVTPYIVQHNFLDWALDNMKGCGRRTATQTPCQIMDSIYTGAPMSNATYFPRYQQGSNELCSSGLCRADTRSYTSNGVGVFETLTKGNQAYNYYLSNGSPVPGFTNGSSLTSVTRWLNGPCATHTGNCMFNTRSHMTDMSQFPGGTGAVESITAYGKIYDFVGGSATQTLPLTSVSYYNGVNQPCSYKSGSQCNLETRAEFTSGSQRIETITAYGRIFNFQRTTNTTATAWSVLNGRPTTSVNRFYFGPCYGLSGTGCALDTRTFYTQNNTTYETITVGDRMYTYTMSGRPVCLTVSNSTCKVKMTAP